MSANGASAAYAPDLIRLPLDYAGPATLAELRVSLPSSMPWRQNEGGLWVSLELLDTWGFHLPAIQTRVQLTLEGGVGALPSVVDIGPEHHGHRRVTGVVRERDRVYRVRARDLDSGLETLSNPLWVPAAAAASHRGLYWGDLHAHRLEVPRQKLADPLLWSYGPATPHEFYQFARDVKALDFAALTDHDYALTTDEWREIQEAAQYYNQPGDFVSFLGYEWAWNQGPDADHGHRNILSLYDDLPLVSSNSRLVAYRRRTGPASCRSRWPGGPPPA